MGSFRCHGCCDFVRTDQRGWDLLDVMDVMTLYALTRGKGSFRLPGCYVCTHVIFSGFLMEVQVRKKIGFGGASE